MGAVCPRRGAHRVTAWGYRAILARTVHGVGAVGILVSRLDQSGNLHPASAESFYKRGKITLVIAKFIPGVNTMAAPLAGSMKMRFPQFLRLDFAGALVYSLTYLLVGYVSRDFLAALLRGFHAAGRAMEAVIVAALAVYAIYRIVQYRKNKTYSVVPRIQVEELARRLASQNADRVQIVDVRSHGYYDSGSSRIKNSIRIEPNNLEEEIKNLPKDKDIYLYCT